MKQKKNKRTSVKVSSPPKKIEKSNLLNSKPFLIGLTILTAVIILFPTLNADFTNWDDNKFIVNNPYIKDISAENFSGMYDDNPGTSLFSFMSWSIEYELFELNPTAFHATNLILHIICVILVFQFIYLLCNQLHVSFFTTLFFVVHPMHVEAVAWITGRSWLFCTAFCLATFIYYIKYYKERKQRYFLISLGFYGLALLSQGAAMSLAPLLLMIDFLFKRKLDKKLILEKLPYLIMAILLLIFTLSIRHQSNVTVQVLTLFDRILTASYSFVFHFYKLFWPTDLTPFYPIVQKVNGQMPGFLYYYFGIAIGLTGLAIASIKKTRLIGFGFGFFLMTVLPLIRLVPVNSQYLMADRYTYMAHLGMIFCAVMGANELIKTKSFKSYKNSILGIGIILIGLLAYQSNGYAKVWNDSISLWSRVLEVYPNVHTAYYNRANKYSALKEYPKAVADFTSAINVDPKHYGSWNNRGFAYNLMKLYDKAAADYTAAAKLEPDNPEVYYNRGIAYGQNGFNDKALTDLNKAIELKSDYTQAYNNRGIVLSMKGFHERALADFNKSIQLESNNGNAYINRAMAYFSLKQYEQALKDAKTAKSMGMKMDNVFMSDLMKKLNANK